MGTTTDGPMRGAGVDDAAVAGPAAEGPGVADTSRHEREAAAPVIVREDDGAAD